MALRALNYVEAQHADWTERALTFLAGLRPDRTDILLWRALSQLRVTAANESSLMVLVERGDLLGGVAAALLWDAVPDRRGWLLELLLDASRGYNFPTRLAGGLSRTIADAEAIALLRRLSSMPVDEDTEQLLRCGEEVAQYVGVIAAASRAVTRLSVADRIAYARSGSILVRRVVAESLWYVREPSAVAFMQELILAGDDHAIVDLHFQLRHGKPPSEALPRPLPTLVAALLDAIRRTVNPNGRSAYSTTLSEPFRT